jgi:hypothetical protein
MKKSFILLMLILTLSLFAEIPNTISWQGVLTDADGNFLDGNYDLTVKLYDAYTNGNELWSEIHSDTEINEGFVNLILGSVESLDLDFDAQYWLEITIAEGTPLTRIALNSVPYSFYSQKAGGEFVADSLVLKDSEGDTRFVINPENGTFKMLDNDTVWYSMSVNSSRIIKSKNYNGMDIHDRVNGRTFFDDAGNILLTENNVITSKNENDKYIYESEVLNKETGTLVEYNKSETHVNRDEEGNCTSVSKHEIRETLDDNGHSKYKEEVFKTDDFTVQSYRKYYQDGVIKREEREYTDENDFYVQEKLFYDSEGNLARKEIARNNVDDEGNEFHEFEEIFFQDGAQSKRTIKRYYNDIELISDEWINGELSNKKVSTSTTENNDFKDDISSKTENFINDEKVSEHNKSVSIWTADNSRTIQESNSEYINSEKVTETFSTKSIPADGGDITEEITEKTLNDNSTSINTKKTNGEVSEKSTWKKREGTDYRTQREKTTFSRDENDKLTETTQYNNEMGSKLFSSSKEIDRDTKKITNKVEDTEGNSTEFIQSGEEMWLKTDNSSVKFDFEKIELIAPKVEFKIPETWLDGDLKAKGVKLFVIDHPTDDTKYLQHAAIESNEVLNQYSGNVTTDSEGMATVTLPDYFDDINTDFRYQLTIVGTTFARGIVYAPIEDNEFTIKTDEPNITVSWLVIAKRNDEYMQDNPFEDEVDK